MVCGSACARTHVHTSATALFQLSVDVGTGYSDHSLTNKKKQTGHFFGFFLIFFNFLVGV